MLHNDAEAGYQQCSLLLEPHSWGCMNRHLRDKAEMSVGRSQDVTRQEYPAFAADEPIQWNDISTDRVKIFVRYSFLYHTAGQRLRCKH